MAKTPESSDFWSLFGNGQTINAFAFFRNKIICTKAPKQSCFGVIRIIKIKANLNVKLTCMERNEFSPLLLGENVV